MASEAAQELHDALGPAFTDLDTNGQLLALCEAMVSGTVNEVHELVVDMEGRPGWQGLLDPSRCPPQFLGWLGQWAGVVPMPGMSVAEQREAIQHPQAFLRGTPKALEAMVKMYLTGTKSVFIEERFEGYAWRLRVRTLKSETPEPEVLKAAIKARQKPVGVVLTYEAVSVWEWSEVWGKYASWTLAKAANATWTILRTRPPGF